jgi:SAM-dependent methyltransferase
MTAENLGRENEPLKSQVREFWDRAACGEKLLLQASDKQGYIQQMRKRYELEPFIHDFAKFNDSRGLRVLEIGVGLGADHQSFAENGAVLTGVDLTQRAIDAERLPFADECFDIVYSWGVLHHSPDTPRAFQEVHRVLKPGGIARIMIYSKYSLVGLMLWLRYGLLRLRPWTSLAAIYSKHLESPGTKAYTVKEAHQLCAPFAKATIQTKMTHGDLLESDAGQRHRGALLSVARLIWPRWFFHTFTPNAGLFMLIECHKAR